MKYAEPSDVYPVEQAPAEEIVDAAAEAVAKAAVEKITASDDAVAIVEEPADVAQE